MYMYLAGKSSHVGHVARAFGLSFFSIRSKFGSVDRVEKARVSLSSQEPHGIPSHLAPIRRNYSASPPARAAIEITAFYAIDSISFPSKSV